MGPKFCCVFKLKWTNVFDNGAQLGALELLPKKINGSNQFLLL
jgi:hypothetical protein